MYAARRSALRRALAPLGVDALLVTDLTNIRYLTGFTGSNAALLVHVEGDPASRFCTDGRYRAQAAAEVGDLDTVVERASATALAGLARGLDVARLGFESDAVTVEAFDALDDAAEGVALHRAPGLVAALRAVKDDTELAAIAAACAAADAALADLLAAGGLRPGRTEREVARDLEGRMQGHGAAEPSFRTIVATGAHSAIPHHRPTDAPLRGGDLLTMDFGALVDGYRSDMTRTVVLGPAAPWQRELYDLVAAAQRAGCAAVAPGTPVAAVDGAARAVIEAAGRGEEFVHGIGHGVGLEIHEAPAMTRAGTDRLDPAMVVTVEPGVYLQGRGGVRVEDTMVVRAGGPEVLTRTTTELLEI